MKKKKKRSSQVILLINRSERSSFDPIEFLSPLHDYKYANILTRSLARRTRSFGRMGNTQRWFQMHRRYDCFGAHFARTISRYVISLPTGSEVNHSWLTHEFIREPNPLGTRIVPSNDNLGDGYHESFLQMWPISIRETKSKITFLLLYSIVYRICI